MYVVTVNFQVKPECRKDFMVGMLANARASLDLEEACLQFDVCVASDDDCSVFLYEIYRSEADFDLHLGMQHFLAFNAASSAQVESKSVRTYLVASSSSGSSVS
jgi:(4S)-4-hydroxy-5-phosphonooxypentane-2,3-dione isomerase